MEETIFYPEFRRRAAIGEEQEEVLEAHEEHNVVKTLIGHLETLDPKDETYKLSLFEKDELEELGERTMTAKSNSGPIGTGPNSLA